MKISISILLILFGFALTAQNSTSKYPVNPETGQIEFQEVVDENGTQEDLFNRSIYWLNDYYKDPDQGYFSKRYRNRKNCRPTPFPYLLYGR